MPAKAPWSRRWCLRPSHQHPCIEGWTELGFEALSAPLAKATTSSAPEHEDFVMALFGDACAMETDKEGRILLPADLVAHAGLTDNVVFIGTQQDLSDLGTRGRRPAPRRGEGKGQGGAD